LVHVETLVLELIHAELIGPSSCGLVANFGLGLGLWVCPSFVDTSLRQSAARMG
jgi:hypothetical protein